MMVVAVQHLGLASLAVLPLVVVAWCLRRWMPRHAILRYDVDRWLAVALVCLLPWQALCVHYLPMEQLTSLERPRRASPTANESTVTIPLTASANSSWSSGNSMELLPPTSAPASVPETRPIQGPFSGAWVAAAFVIYVIGLVTSLVVLAVRVGLTWRMLRNCVAMDFPKGSPAIARLRELGRVRLLESTALAAPACVRLPRLLAIVLPAGSVRQLNAEAVECVLEHESVHLVRRDWLFSALRYLYHTLFWFHPGVWYLAKQMQDDCELSCDALVVHRTGLRRTYAETLLHFHDPNSRQADLLLANQFYSVRSLSRRLRMLVHSRSQVSRRSRRMMIGALALASLCLCGWQAHLVAAAGLHDTVEERDQAEHRRAKSRKRVKTEIRARKEGRSATSLYSHLTQAFQLHGMSPGSWITNQETVVHARDAEWQAGTLMAKDVYVNLPEGSELRAELTARDLVVDPSGDHPMIYADGASVTVFDEQGQARFRSDPEMNDLIVEITIAEEVTIRLRRKQPDGKDLPVRLVVDLTSGIPEQEDQPPHNTVRYAVLESEGNDPFRIKMQWIYNLAQLEKDAENEASKLSPSELSSVRFRAARLGED